jgi:hypothetical protein
MCVPAGGVLFEVAEVDAPGALEAPERPGLAISAPATPPTVTAATTTPAATMRRPFILHPSAMAEFC